MALIFFHGEKIFMNNGISIQVGTDVLTLTVCGENIIRVQFLPKGKWPEYPSLVVVDQFDSVDFTVEDDHKNIFIFTQFLKVKVRKQTGQLSFYRRDGATLLREPDSPRRMEPALVTGEKVFHCEQRFQFSDDEALFGLGQFQDGVMNYRQKEVLLVQANKIAVVPFLISTRGYGILWDNYSKTKFLDGTEGATFWSEVAEQIDYYFIAGENMDGVIAGNRQITGAAPLFARWAFGYWQSKERYRDRQDLVNTIKQYRERKLPIDVIVQDWRYWGDNDQWSSMEWEESIFPRPAEMIEELHQKYHARLMVSIWPAVGKKSKIFRELNEQKLLYRQDHWGSGKVYDAFSDDARRIYWKYIKTGLFDNGVDAFWMDGTEPEFSNTDTQEITEREFKKCTKTALGSVARYLNAYSLMTTRGVYQNQRKLSPHKRVFILTRSAFAGQQRHAAATWSGDIGASWEVFRKQITAGINFCMAGIPYWSMDIGGFFPWSHGGDYFGGVEDPAFRELYVRWFQFGAFTPIFRAHGTGTPREVWQFGEPGSKTYQALSALLKLRYRLLPYIYSVAWRVTSEGYTMMRGLPMDFPDDQNVYEIGDQYLFGPAIMVKPVTHEMFHRTVGVGETIAGHHLLSLDRTPGLNGAYFNGASFEKLANSRIDAAVNFNWDFALPEKIIANNYSIRWEGWLVSEESGVHELSLLSSGSVRLRVNGKLLVDNWTPHQRKMDVASLKLNAGEKAAVRLDFAKTDELSEITLAWKTPAMLKQLTQKPLNPEVDLYLPANCHWYDFWYGQSYPGGQAIVSKPSLEIIPLFVRSGSIIPLGPEMQFATEKPADPIELRIYPGSDAGFDLYEDENDNYNYEKGSFSIIPFHWSDESMTLKIGARKGSFPGMLSQRTFYVVVVRPDKGLGIDQTLQPDRIVRYDGNEVEVFLG